jgi:hypothetical protein
LLSRLFPVALAIKFEQESQWLKKLVLYGYAPHLKGLTEIDEKEP